MDSVALIVVTGESLREILLGNRLYFLKLPSWSPYLYPFEYQGLPNSMSDSRCFATLNHAVAPLSLTHTGNPLLGHPASVILLLLLPLLATAMLLLLLQLLLLQLLWM